MNTFKPRLIVALIITMLTCGKLFGQEDFKNEGEQEAFWAKRAFSTYYQKQNFEKYDGSIVVQDGTYIYGKKTIKVYCQPEFKVLFKKGVINPDMLLFSESIPGVSKKVAIQVGKTDSIISDSTSARAKLPHFSLNSLTIGQFEELKSLETSPKQRRFRFLYNIAGLTNPILDFIELTNDKANVDMDMTTFIKGARVTYLCQGSLLI